MKKYYVMEVDNKLSQDCGNCITKYTREQTITLRSALNESHKINTMLQQTILKLRNQLAEVKNIVNN